MKSKITAVAIALCAMAAAHRAGAITYRWTGASATDGLYKYSTANNWWDETNKAKNVPRADNNAQDNLDFRTKANYIGDTASRTIYFDGAKTNYWKLHVREAGSADDPVVFTASEGGGIKAGANTSKTGQQGFYIANDKGNAFLRIDSGTYDTGNHGYWFIGSTNFTGNVTANGGTTVGAKKNIEVVNGSLVLNGATMASSGTVHIGGYGSNNLGAPDTHAVLEMNGGTASSAGNTEIGNFSGSKTGGYALLSVKGGATYTCGLNLQMGAANGIAADQAWLAITNGTVNVSRAVYVNGGAGGIAIGDKGTLDITGDSNGTLCIADGGRGYASVGGDFAITLGTGGILETPSITNRTSTASQQVKLNFEGGTLKAKVAHGQFITDASQLTVTVNENGGIIDTSGKAITIPKDITAAAGAQSIGAMTIMGGGNVKFSGTLACGVKAFSGTVLGIGSTATAESLLENGALKITAVVSSDSNPVTDDVFADYTDAAASMPTAEQIATIPITFEDGTDASEEYALEASGTSILWKNISAPTWTGAADGNFSNAANWKNGKKPENGAKVYFAATAPVTANNDIEGLSVSQIVFAEGSAAATIAGNEIEVTGSVVNNSRAAQTISAPVVFTGDITTTMADAASTVTYAGGVTGAKIAYTTEAERHLYGDYTLTTTDTWPDTTGGQYNLSDGVQWWIHGTLRVANANLRNCTIESGAKVYVETAKMDRYQFVERVTKASGDNMYYALLTRANHGLYSIGKIETYDAIELSPAYSAEDYEDGMTIAGGIEYIGMGSATQTNAFPAKVASPFAFYFSPGHRVTSGLRAGAGAAAWAIGASGLALTSSDSPNGNYNAWYRIDGDTTLNSTADWTLAENPANIPPYGATGVDTEKMNAVKTWAASNWVKNETVASLSIDNGATLTIDTSHYATNGETGVAGHTVTFEGQVQGDATAKVAAAGDGTLFWKARGAKFTGTMAVGAGARLRLAGDGYGFQLAGLEIAAGGTLEIDPVVKPASLAQPPQFAGGAKIALDPYYAATTLGKFTLLTWTGGEATIPEGLFDTSSVAQGAACALAVETAPDGSSKQLVLRVGDYEKDAKAIRIAPIGDSITQGVGGSGYATYRKSMAALLAARGYKPTLLGAWRFGVYDSAGVRQPEEWLWHTGFSGDSVLTTENPNNATNFKCGAFDNLHLYLDIVGVPDAIVLFIGTNDMSGGNKEGDVAYVGWTNLVWKIYEQRPQTKIVAGTALDRVLSTTVTGRQNVFNANIRAAYKAGELPPTLSLVDLADYDNVPISIYTTIGNDGTHPNWNGHAYIARHFADGVAEALPLATFEPTTDTTVTDEPQTAIGAENIPELAKWRRGFTRAYAIDIAPTNGIPTTGDAPYTWTNPEVEANASIAKVGYYMELVRKGTNRRRWVWVDMDATGKTLDDVDFPWNAPAYRQEAVSKLHVKSNDFGIHEVSPRDDSVWGIVEATPYGYSKTPVEIDAGDTTVKNLLPGQGWCDTMFTDPANAPYGCFQAHRVFSAEQKLSLVNNRLDAETLFAWNRWASTRGDQGDDLGIGPFFCSAAIDGGTQFTADYTHSANKQGNLYDTTGACAYSVRRLEIWYATQASIQRGVILMVK